MFKENTVFIVGAVASYDYKLPLGEQLKKNIRNTYTKPLNQFWNNHIDTHFKLFGPNFFRRTFEEHNTIISAGKFEEAARIIVNALGASDSIDRALETHQEKENIQLLGKLAIVHEILFAERESTLLEKNTPPFRQFGDPYLQKNIGNFSYNPNLEETWINKFFSILTQQRPYSERHKVFENISIICFNYDRCIEFYLLHLLMFKYDIEKKEAIQILSNLKIFHPYGTVGQIVDPNGDFYMPFGGFDQLDTNWLDFTKSLITFTQRKKVDADRLNMFKHMVSNSPHIIHLGFGLETMNSSLYIDNKIHYNDPRIYSTAFGQSIEEIENLKEEFLMLFDLSRPAIIYNCSCFEFLDKISRRIKI